MHIERMKLTYLKNLTPSQAPFSSIVAFAALIAGHTVFAAEPAVFKQVNPDGTVSFTDKKNGNSVAIPSSEPNVLKTPVSKRKTNARTTTEGNKPESPDPRPLTVNSVEITSPKHDRTFINPRGAILIGVATGPENGLPEGHTTEIKMNGSVVSRSEGTLVSVPSPDRGSYLVEARILSETGAVQASSKPITIHVRRTYIRREE